MDKNQPDKWVRKAVYEAIGSLVVGGNTIPVYDYRADDDSPLEYVIMGQQNNAEVRSKCDYNWRHDILLEVVVRGSGINNTVDRAQADDILQAVRLAVNDLSLDVASGLNIITQVYSYPGDLNQTVPGESVVRKFLRIELHIN